MSQDQKKIPHPKNDQVEYLENLMEIQNDEIEMLQRELGSTKVVNAGLVIISVIEFLFIFIYVFIR